MFLEFAKFGNVNNIQYASTQHTMDWYWKTVSFSTKMQLFLFVISPSLLHYCNYFVFNWSGTLSSSKFLNIWKYVEVRANQIWWMKWMPQRWYFKFPYFFIAKALFFVYFAFQVWSDNFFIQLLERISVVFTSYCFIIYEVINREKAFFHQPVC